MSTRVDSNIQLPFSPGRSLVDDYLVRFRGVKVPVLTKRDQARDIIGRNSSTSPYIVYGRGLSD